MTTFQGVVAALATVNVCAFAWGVWGVFVKKGQAGGGLTVIKLSATFAAVAVVWSLWTSTSVQGWTGLVGALVLTASLLIFVLCVLVNRAQPLSLAYSPDEPVHMQRSGPYRFVRHPFYLSYLLTYVGAFVASQNMTLLGVVLAMTAVYTHAALIEERKFLNSPLGDDYVVYRRQAGMFLPRIARRR